MLVFNFKVYLTKWKSDHISNTYNTRIVQQCFRIAIKVKCTTGSRGHGRQNQKYLTFFEITSCDRRYLLIQPACNCCIMWYLGLYISLHDISIRFYFYYSSICLFVLACTRRKIINILLLKSLYSIISMFFVWIYCSFTCLTVCEWIEAFSTASKNWRRDLYLCTLSNY